MVVSFTEIQVLSFMDAIRKRPAMYCGEPDEAPSHLVQAAMCMSLSRSCTTTVTVNIWKDHFTVEDDGPGWPVDLNAKGMPRAELLMTALFACREEKLTDEQGLCKTGIVVANALSSSASLTTWTDNFEWVQTYTKGVPDGPLKRTGWVDRHGALLSFTLDSTIFPEPKFSTDLIGEWIREHCPPNVHAGFFWHE